jgi:hypothetical protein
VHHFQNKLKFKEANRINIHHVPGGSVEWKLSYVSCKVGRVSEQYWVQKVDTSPRNSSPNSCDELINYLFFDQTN